MPSYGQIKMNYHFGFIGTTGDTTAKLSEPVLIGYDNCFDITNGLPKFKSPKFGVFSIACFEAKPKMALQVNAYPNPVVNVLTMRSLINFPEKDFVKYKVVFTDISGKVLRQVNTDLQHINEGFVIPVRDLPTGYFIVTLYSDKELVQSFKILKAA